MVKHRKRNDRDSKGIEDLDVHVDVEVVDVEVEDVEVEDVEVEDVEDEDMEVNVNQDRVKGAPVVDNKVAKEALVDVGEDEDVAPHVKLQVDKTGILLIEPMFRRCNFLALPCIDIDDSLS
jgi:hypothetical protein